MAGLTADEAAVDAVLSASRTLIGGATRSLGAVAEETAIAQYRAYAAAAGEVPGIAWPSAQAATYAAAPASRLAVRAGTGTAGRA